MRENDPRDIVVVSAGTAAEVIYAYLRRFSNFNVVGFTVDRDHMPDGKVMNKPVVPWDTVKTEFPPEQVRLIGPPTYARLNTYRRDRYYEGLEMGYDFASFIHPDSNIMTDDIGDHVIILDQCVVLPGTRIGNNVIIWCNTHVGHHCTIGDHVFMSSQVGIGGSTTVGEETYLAGQAGVMNKARIGARCAILNQAGIKQAIPDDSVVVGAESRIKPYSSAKIKRLL